jgi:hypothetical protein
LVSDSEPTVDDNAGFTQSTRPSANTHQQKPDTSQEEQQAFITMVEDHHSNHLEQLIPFVQWLKKNENTIKIPNESKILFQTLLNRHQITVNSAPRDLLGSEQPLQRLKTDLQRIFHPDKHVVKHQCHGCVTGLYII